jgi:hypothetical protein
VFVMDATYLFASGLRWCRLGSEAMRKFAGKLLGDRVSAVPPAMKIMSAQN